jgi:hypothetical protein
LWLTIILLFSTSHWSYLLSNILGLWSGQEAHDSGAHVRRALRYYATCFAAGIDIPSQVYKQDIHPYFSTIPKVSSHSQLHSVAPTINPILTTSPTMTAAVDHCVCPHTEDSHYLIRCGCPNPNNHSPKHPMSQMDDAFHRVWCSDCLLYCDQPLSCPGLHSKTRVHYLNAILMGLQTSFRGLLACASYLLPF